jgi:peptide chain release factor 2
MNEILQELTEALTNAKQMLEGNEIPNKIKELEAQTQADGIWDNQREANALFGKLKALKNQWEPVETMLNELQDLQELYELADEAEQQTLDANITELQAQWQELETKLYLSGEYDHNNCYLSITSGAGGTEAQDWAGMLLRMYLRYCERMDWKTEIVERTEGAEAGIKSITVLVQGSPAYGFLQCERGTHRLVRLSPFNAKSLRQTSFALVEVLPEIPESADITIDPSDLRVDTFRASGAGGQHVNKTDSAIRITHEPSGIVVASQNSRSQQANRITAMNMLRAKLVEQQEQERAAKQDGLKGANKSADFGQQIRSYVLHPYQMVKDLRSNYESNKTDAVLDGDLQGFVDSVLKL